MFAPRGWVSRPLARRIYKTIAGSELFDRRWYRRHQMRGVLKLTDPLWHFLALGRKHQLDPSPMFDTAHYISSHPDVRDSNLNPLFHYIEYGISERRQPIRSVQETFHHLFPDSTELPTFLTPRVRGPRLTVVIDQATLDRTDLTLAEVLDSSARHAEEHSRELRIISLLADHSVLVSEAAERSLSRKVSGLDIVTAPPHGETTHYEAHDDEIFVGTSWSSSAAIRHAARPDNLWFLGATGLEALSRDLWRRQSLDRALTSGNQHPDDVMIALTAPGTPAPNTIKLAIHADPRKSPAVYAWALTEVEALLQHNPSLTERLMIVLVGENLRPVNFLHSVPATVTSVRAQGESTLRLGTHELITEGAFAERLRGLVGAGVSHE